MTRIFHCIFGRKDSSYDGYFISYDNGKIVGYTDDGILTGAVTSEICETQKDYWREYPVMEDFIGNGKRLDFLIEGETVTMKLYEKQYSYEKEETILERTIRKAEKKLPVDVQIALEKFLEAGETDT